MASFHAARIVVCRAVAVAAALAVSTGCEGDRAAACTEIAREFAQLSDQVVTADWQEQAKAYSKAADAVRRAGEKAGGDVQALGNDLAAYLEAKSRKIAENRDREEGLQLGYNLSGVCA